MFWWLNEIGVGNNLDDFSENEYNDSVFEKDFTSGNNDVAQDETLATANYDVGEEANDTGKDVADH